MSSILLVVMNVGLAAVVYLVLVRRIDRRLEPGRVVENIRSEINSIIVELNQTTDRNIGLLEDRVTRLNSVLEQADRRLAVLKREVESRSSSSQRYNDILQKARTPRKDSAAGASSASEPAASRDTSAPAGQSAAGESAAREEVSREPVGVPGSGPAAGDERPAAGNERPAGGRAERRERIVDLHRKGIASNIIANRVGSTVGEVELIISLADRKE